MDEHFIRRALLCALLMFAGLAAAEEEMEAAGDSLAPDLYNDPMLSRSGINLQDYEQAGVDLFSGTMSRTATDLSLPGQGGLALTIQRTYRSLQPYEFPGATAVGLGWSMHFGWVEIRDIRKMCNPVWSVSIADNPVLHLPDGTTDIMAMSEAGKAYVFDSTEIHYRGRSGFGINCLAGNITSADTVPEFRLLAPDGTRYHFTVATLGGGLQGFHATARWYVNRIEDRHGNWIAIDYTRIDASDTIFTPLKVTTSDGKVVHFVYNGARLQSLKLGTRVVAEYTYADSGIASNTPQLLSVRLGQLLAWSYAYSSWQEPGAGSMVRATNPYGGITDYEWARVYFQAGDHAEANAAVVRTRQSGPSTTTAEWSYAYFPATVSDLRDRTVVTSPEGVHTYFHHSALAVVGGQLWKTGLKDRVEFEPHRGGKRIEEYGWEPYFISPENNTRVVQGGFYRAFDENYYGPYLAWRKVTIDGREWLTEYNSPYPAPWLGEPQAQVIRMSSPSGSLEQHRRYTDRPARHLYLLPTEDYIFQADAPGVTTLQLRYDEEGYLRTRFEAGVWTHYEYDDFGNLEMALLDSDEAQSEGQQVHYRAYAYGIARQVSFEDLSTQTLELDERGRVTRSTNRDGEVRRYTYDDVGRVKSIGYALGNGATVSYAGRLATLTRGGYRKQTETDAFGRLVRETHIALASGATPERRIEVRYQYDAAGNRTFTSYPNSTAGVARTYDGYGRTLEVTHPGGERRLRYTGGTTITTTDERGVETRTVQRAIEAPWQGPPVRIESPEGIVTAIDYNEHGKPLRVAQSGGGASAERTWRYDGNQRLVESHEPETGTARYSYDRGGRVAYIARTPPGSTEVLGQDNDYDMLGRLSRVVAPGSRWTDQHGNRHEVMVELQFFYTYDGKPWQQARSSSHRVTTPGGTVIANGGYSNEWWQSYDANGNLLEDVFSEPEGDRQAFTYTYDANDRMASIGYPDGTVMDLAPDAFGWQTRAGDHATEIAFSDAGQLAGFRYGNGRRMQVSTNDRFLTAALAVPGVASLAYAYDAAGNLTSLTDNVDAAGSVAIGYDGMGRMVQADGRWGQAGYGYDALGNLRTRTINGAATVMHYDANNRLLAMSGATVREYGHDAFGNVSRMGGAGLRYDGLGNLVQVDGGASYQYDARGRRVREERPGLRTLGLYAAGDRLMYEVVGAGEAVRRHVHVGNFVVARVETASYDCADDEDGDGIPHCTERENGLDPYDPADALYDEDVDGLSNVDEYRAGTRIRAADSDGDGMVDGYEVMYALDPLVDDGAVDADGDGVDNLHEFLWAMDPHDPADGLRDADGDGLDARAEQAAGSDPLLPDTDEDGLGDAQEVAAGTRPRDGDSDEDGIGDGEEVAHGLDPLDPADAARDDDGDGLDARGEISAGTSLQRADTDADGMPDGYEVDNGLRPRNALDALEHMDRDGDTMPNLWEYLNGLAAGDPYDALSDHDHDRLLAWNEYGHGTDPRRADTDGDFMGDGYEVAHGLDPLRPDAAGDPDNDGVETRDEALADTNPFSDDTDQDGLEDGFELAYGFDPLLADAAGDRDGDGYSNIEEQANGSDPLVPDVLDVPRPVLQSGANATLVMWPRDPEATHFVVRYGIEGDGPRTTRRVTRNWFLHDDPVRGALYGYEVTAVNARGEAVSPTLMSVTGAHRGWDLASTLAADCDELRLGRYGRADFHAACRRGQMVQAMRYEDGRWRDMRELGPVDPAHWQFSVGDNGDAVYAWEEPGGRAELWRYEQDGHAWLRADRVTHVHQDLRMDPGGELSRLYSWEHPQAEGEQHFLVLQQGRMPLQVPPYEGVGSEARPYLDARLGSDRFVYAASGDGTGLTVRVRDRRPPASPGGEWAFGSWLGLPAGTLSRLAADGPLLAFWHRPAAGTAADLWVGGFMQVPGSTDEGFYVRKLVTGEMSPAPLWAYGNRHIGHRIYAGMPGGIRSARMSWNATLGLASWAGPSLTAMEDPQLLDPSTIRFAGGGDKGWFFWRSGGSVVGSESTDKGGWQPPFAVAESGEPVVASADRVGNVLLAIAQDGQYRFHARTFLSPESDYAGDATPPRVFASKARTATDTAITRTLKLSTDEPANIFFEVAGAMVVSGALDDGSEQRYTGPVVVQYPPGGTLVLRYRAVNLAGRWSTPVTETLK